MDFLLSTILKINQSSQKKFDENTSTKQESISPSKFAVVGVKITISLSAEHIHWKNTKIFVFLKYIQFKVI